ncbi:MAG: restriction endonuclease subunit S [Desulfuromonadaceae bacterium]|nr:restriction endonuclease subunit S [Desulfuromonadaceae bacterium]MDD5105358.1 restriction endonuclease subunit S [Desulfuromonadaceae bacterium]
MTSSLKSGWVVKPLIEVATLQRGYDLPVQNRSLGNVPIFAANGPVGNHNEAKVSGPGVITGRSGSIGKVHYVNSDYWPLNTALYVKDFHGNDPKFIYYLLSTFGLEKYSEGTGVPTLNRNNVHGVNVPLPPLPEQKCIAAILDKADSIRRKRQEAVQLTEELLRSVFLDMFGDPVTNPKGWEIKSLSDEIEFLTSGSRGWAEFYSDSGRKFIRIQNVKNGLLHFNDVQYVTPPDNKEAARTKVQENDLLISITADLGRTAVVDKITAIEGAHINQHLALVRLSKAFNPHFVAAYLESEGGKRQFLQLDQPAVKSGMNFDSIKSLHLFSPPLKLQNQYASFVHALENTKGKLRTSLEVTDTLFNSLLQRAFKGEL